MRMQDDRDGREDAVLQGLRTLHGFPVYALAPTV